MVIEQKRTARSVGEGARPEVRARYRGAAYLWTALRRIADGYFDKRVPRMAAALSYYTIFSLAPLLVIAIAVAGMVFGQDVARARITSQFQGLVGEQGGKAINAMVENTQGTGANGLVAVFGLLTLLIGATSVFGELQDSLNTIWEVRAQPGQSIRSFIHTRLLSFAMVFGIGFLLLVSLVVSAAISALGSLLGHRVEVWKGLAEWADTGISFIAVGLLFAGAFKLLPDVAVRWRDVWVGAAVTSLLFVVGKYGIGLYLGSSAISSSYGAMGSLAVLLIWIYYSSQVFLIGALFTQTRATLSGFPLRPIRGAEWIPGRQETQNA